MKTAPEKICQDACSNIDWADWHMDQLTSGYMYCCDVQELMQVIPEIPDLRDDINDPFPSMLIDKKPKEVQIFPEGSCIIDMEIRAKGYRPSFVQNGEFIYPTIRRLEDKNRLLVFGMTFYIQY